ncbi:MAG: terminase family protein, partial [Pseudomonadota bacterium]
PKPDAVRSNTCFWRSIIWNCPTSLRRPHNGGMVEIQHPNGTIVGRALEFGWPLWQFARDDPRLLDAADLVPFLVEARESQRPPPGFWRNWLFMGGRGSGKTRAGAEWVRFGVQHAGMGRVALVGTTLADVREVMIEGPSGLRALHFADEASRPVYQSSRRRLVFDNGAEAYAFSAEDPDSLRGPQFHGAWCDELAAWPKGGRAWHQLQLGLRLGEVPRVCVTTTPRPLPLIKRLLVDPQTVVTRSTTEDNAAHLAPGFADAAAAQLGDPMLIRQELFGEIVEGGEHAIWSQSMIDDHREEQAPTVFEDIVVGVDPPVSLGRHADACGIIAAGRATAAGFGVRCFVLADASVQGLKPLDWAARASRLAERVGARRVVAEANQGGEMVRELLNTAGCPVPVELVHARLGKAGRAQPVSALYAKGLVAHVGPFKALEQELLTFGTDAQEGSPDRMDALVWAVRALMVDGPGAPRLRAL